MSKNDSDVLQISSKFRHSVVFQRHRSSMDTMVVVGGARPDKDTNEWTFLSKKV